ncbi:MAG: RecX family transcriptional regulator [Bacilli bacterium]|nr:RecX family transcriptional regulator [Bacilli bacterium]
MNIIKYKKLRDNRYKVILDNNIELTLYEDIILKYELLIKKSIDDKLLKKIKKDNEYYECYYYALKSINSRSKSKYDMKKLLLNKEYDNKYVIDVISLLEKQGYLNDDSYAYSFINDKMITTNWGPYKIRGELLKHKVDEEIINNNLEVFSSEEELIRIEKLVDKMIKSNKSTGGIVLKNKIKNNIINLGYDISLINDVLDKTTISVDKDIVKKEYDKLYKRYSKKYKDKELEYVIKNKLYQKGLYYEE